MANSEATWFGHAGGKRRFRTAHHLGLRHEGYGDGAGRTEGRPSPAPARDGTGRLDPATFEAHESRIRSYCRSFPAIFVQGSGSRLIDSAGRSYIDFFAGAGSLNYGHNAPHIKTRLIRYLESDGVLHSLDLHTEAKHDFLTSFVDTILRPRGYDYKMMFPGPTGTNAVELAVKVARKATGRHAVIAFTNAFHGMSQGSLALSGNRDKRAGAGLPLSGVARVPYDGYLGPDVDTADLLERMLEDTGSGFDAPAAIILETVQAEGGLNVASVDWLRRVAEAARRHGALLIVDDIQTGCGRTGSFFSFEGTGVEPDLVCLSKSIGGIGLPLALVLVKPQFDVMAPGEHNGTFRGNNLGFVAATAALDYWRDPAFERRLGHLTETLRRRLGEIVARYPAAGAHVRGRGAIVGIGWNDMSLARRVSEAAYARGLIAETCGAAGQVLKLLPPLTVDDDDLDEGFGRLTEAVAETVDR